MMSNAARMALAIVSMMILLAAGATGNWFFTRDAVSTAEHAIATAITARQAAAVAQQDQYNLCISVNQARAQQIQLWDFIISLSPPKDAQARHNLAVFEVYLHKVFAPRNCGQP